MPRAAKQKTKPATKVAEALDYLRHSLLALKPEGDQGFEGLLATILADFSGRPVRIAKSGAQFGQDAVGSDPSTIISIEAKLYRTNPSKAVILSKPTELLTKPNAPDLWLLGVTADAGAQITDATEAFSARTGIASEILDWPEASPAPPLAAYCFLAPKSAIEFLLSVPLKRKMNVDEAKLRGSFQRLRRSRPLMEARDALAERLSAPSIGLAEAKSANKVWLLQCFESQSTAKAEFGCVSEFIILQNLS